MNFESFSGAPFYTTLPVDYFWIKVMHFVKFFKYDNEDTQNNVIDKYLSIVAPC